MSDKEFVSLALISGVFFITILLGIFAFAYLIKVTNRGEESNQTKYFNSLIYGGNLLRILVIFLCVYAFLVYSIMKSDIDPTVVSFLSGIAGFALGGLNVCDKDMG